MGSTGTGLNIEYIPDAETRFTQDDDGWNLIVDEWATVYEGSTTAVGIAYTSRAHAVYHRWEMFKLNDKDWLHVEWKDLSFNERYKIVKEYFSKWDAEWYKADKTPWDGNDPIVILMILEQA